MAGDDVGFGGDVMGAKRFDDKAGGLRLGFVRERRNPSNVFPRKKF